MNNPEQRNSQFKPEVMPRLERFDMAHEKAAERINEELFQRHQDKPYHNPEHTLGIEGATHPDGVVNSINHLSGLVRKHFVKSLQPVNDAGEQSFAIKEKAMEAGARAHDVIIELDGVTETGTVIRRRGWQEGGNERESFLRFRHVFIEEHFGGSELSKEAVEYHHQELLTEDSLYGEYIESVEQTVAGTDPDNTAFGALVPDEYVKDASPLVSRALHNDAGLPTYLRLDSTKTGESLEALLSSTADLMAASYPERFFTTGNGEFWELHVGIAKDCERFLSEGGIGRDRAIAMLGSMQGWRKVQVGVALGQRMRLEQNFTEENITSLFEKTFKLTPEAAEVKQFVERVLDMTAAMEISTEESAQRFEQFQANFQIAETGEETLTEAEQDTFLSAIKFMGGEQGGLARYVTHVETDIGSSV